MSEEENTWIQTNIQQRRCVGFCQFDEKKKTSCKCYRSRKEHQEPIKETDDWSFSKNTKTEACRNFGTIQFEDGKSSKFVRLDFETRMSVVKELLLDIWNLPDPKWIISIMGDKHETKKDKQEKKEDEHKKKRDDKSKDEELKTHLATAMSLFSHGRNIWVTTEGLNFGVAKVIGQIPHKDKQKGSPSLVGIFGWAACQPETIKSLENEKSLENNNESNRPSVLYPHHLLVDNGSLNGGLAHTTFQEFRTALETSLTNHSDESSSLPLVILLYGGWSYVIDGIVTAIENNVPIVVLKGTGGFADILAKVYETSTEDPVNTSTGGHGRTWTGTVIDDRLREDVEKSFMDIHGAVFKEGQHKILQCLQKRELITLVDLDDDSRSLAKALIKALLKTKTTPEVLRTIDYYMPYRMFGGRGTATAVMDVYREKRKAFHEVASLFLFEAMDLDLAELVQFIIDYNGVDLTAFRQEKANYFSKNIIVLKKMHSLEGKGVGVLLVKRIRDSGAVKQFAQFASGVDTSKLSDEDLDERFRALTGEDIAEILGMAGKETETDHRRLACHFAIVLANELGQPRGKDLPAGTSQETPDPPNDPGRKKAKLELERRISKREEAAPDEVSSLRDKNIIVLKKMHSLEGKGFGLLLVRRIRDSGAVKQFAQFAPEVDTSELSDEDTEERFRALTGEDIAEILGMAGKETETDHRRLACHFAIVLANELGQPRGQNLPAGEEADSYKILLRWAVRSGRKKCAALFWKKGNDLLASSLEMTAVIQTMKIKEENIGKQRDLENHSALFQQRALGLIDECYHGNRTDSLYLIQRQGGHNIWTSHNPNSSSPANNQLLDRCFDECNRRIFAREAFKSYMEHVWYGRITPPRMGASKRNMVISLNDLAKESTGDKIKRLLCAPVTTYCLNLIFNVAFLVLFGHTLLFELGKKYTVLEGILVVWWTTFMVEEVRQFWSNAAPGQKHRGKCQRFGAKLDRYFLDNYWNILDCVCLLFFLVGGVLLAVYHVDSTRDDVYQAARLFLSVDIMFFTWRLLQHFAMSSSLGPVLVMIYEMIQNLLPFLAVMLVFIISQGLAAHALLYPNRDWTPQALLYIPKNAYWNIFGELGLDEIEAQEPDKCSSDPRLYQNETKDECPSSLGQYAVPFLLGIYMLLMNVLLLNIIIARFSFTFQKIHEQTTWIAAWQRARVTLEYYKKPSLPPPLNVFFHLGQLICMRCSRKCKCKVGDDKGGTEEKDLASWERSMAENYLASAEFKSGSERMALREKKESSDESQYSYKQKNSGSVIQPTPQTQTHETSTNESVSTPTEGLNINKRLKKIESSQKEMKRMLEEVLMAVRMSSESAPKVGFVNLEDTREVDV